MPISINEAFTFSIKDIVKELDNRGDNEAILTFADGDFLAIKGSTIEFDTIQSNLLRFLMQKVNPSGVEIANTFDMVSGVYLLQKTNDSSIERLDIFQNLLLNVSISNNLNTNLASLFSKQAYNCIRVFIDEMLYTLDENTNIAIHENIGNAFTKIKQMPIIKQKLFDLFMYDKQEFGFLVDNHFDALILNDSSGAWIGQDSTTKDLMMTPSYALYLFFSYFFIEKQGFFDFINQETFKTATDENKNKALTSFFVTCKKNIENTLFELATQENLSIDIKQLSINDVLGYLIYDDSNDNGFLLLLHRDTYLGIVPDDDFDARNLLANIQPANLGIPFESRVIDGKQIDFVKSENLTPKRMTQLQALIKDLYDKKQINDDDIKKLLKKAKNQMPDELKDIKDLESFKKDLLVFLQSSNVPAFKNYASEINTKLNEIKQKNTIIQAQKIKLQDNLMVLKSLSNGQETPLIKEIQAKILEIDNQINDANNRMASINQSIASLKGLSFTSNRYLPKARQLGSFGAIPAIYFVTIPLAIVVVYCVYQLLMPIVNYVQELLNYSELAQKQLLEKIIKELKEKEKDLAKQREIACGKDPNSQDCTNLTIAHEEIKKEIQQKEKEKGDLQKSIDNKKWDIVWKSSLAILGIYAGYKLINTTVDRVLPSKKDTQNNSDNKENEK